MGHGRSEWENAACAALSPWGWAIPGHREQRSVIDGVTTVNADPRGQGRGAPVIDLARPCPGEGAGAFQAFGLKSTRDRGHRTLVLTTGLAGGGEHIDLVLATLGAGLPVAQVVCRPTKGGGAVEGALIDITEVFQAGGRQLGKSGEAAANRLSHPHPLQLRVRRQTSKAGKVYEYTSLELCLSNVEGLIPLRWERIQTWAALAALCDGAPVYY